MPHPRAQIVWQAHSARGCVFPPVNFFHPMAGLLVFLTFLLMPITAPAAEAVLRWSANTEPDLAGYLALYGTQPDNLDQSVDAGNATHITLTGLANGQTYYMAVKAYDRDGNLSAPSILASVDIPLVDTTPPTLVSVETAGPSTLLIRFSEPVDPVTATRTANYTIDGIVQPAQAILETGGTRVRLTTFTQLDGDRHTVQLSAITDTSGNSIVPVSQSYTVDLGLHVGIVSPADYRAVPMLAGASLYLDETAPLATIPPEFNHATLIQTAQGDRNAGSETLLRFTVDRDALVYVGFDPLATRPPDWLTGQFIPAGEGPLGPDNLPLKMWVRNVGGGTVTLGGNNAAGMVGAQNQYAVWVLPMGDAHHAADLDGDRMDDNWETANGLNPQQFDAHADANGNGHTNLQAFWTGADPLAADPGPAPTGNNAPIANTDETVIGTVGTAITLDGAASVDGDNDPLQFGWGQLAGTPLPLSGLGTDRVAFTADTAGLYIFRMIASDGFAADARTIYVEVFNNLLTSIANATQGTLSVAQGALAGAGVELPSGSLEKPSHIAIGERLLPQPLPFGHTPSGPVLHFTPSSVPLRVAATVQVPFTTDPAKPGDTVYTLLHFDPLQNSWLPVSGAVGGVGAMVAQVSRLGTFVVSKSTVPGIDSGGGGGCAALVGDGGTLPSGPGDATMLILPLALMILRILKKRGTLQARTPNPGQTDD